MLGKKNKNSSSKKTSPMIEVVDQYNRPFGVLSLDLAHKLNLYHRRVIILVYNQENKMFLLRRSLKKKRYPGLWELSASSHVLYRESREDTVQRILKDVFRVGSMRLSLLNEYHPTLTGKYEFISIFRVHLLQDHIHLNPKEAQSGEFVEHHELKYILSSFPELLTPDLKCLEHLKYLNP